MYGNKREEFENRLSTASLKQFLTATPYSSGVKPVLDCYLDDIMFFDKLYSDSKYADLVCDEIQRRSEKGNIKNIIISGYKGCGKTTFIHYFSYKISERTLLLNFDDYVNRGNGNEIKTIILLDLYRKITDDIFSSDARIIRRFIEIYSSNHNKRFFSRFIDPDNVFKNFFHILEEAINKSEKDIDDFLDDILKSKMNDMQVHQLLIIFILFDIADRLANGKDKKCYLIFDNLDVIDNTKELEEFTKDISAFRNNVSYILDNISFDGITSEGYNAFQDYTIIFCMRETTKAEFIEHFNDRANDLYIADNISSMYDKEKIVQKRYDYLISLKRQDIESLKQDVLVIKQILQDDYVKGILIKLFNYDYRTSINVLSEIEYNSKNSLAESLKLKSISPSSDWNFYGSRCILFRKIFELFRNNHYFEKIKESEYSIESHESTMAINITRIILLYLRNSQTLYIDTEKIDNQTVSLFELFDDLSKCCDNSEVIVNSIWNMYELRNQSFWNHLVTFDGMSKISLNNLEEQMQLYKEGVKNYNSYGRIRITSAGNAYLENLIIHYEYFATRLNNTLNKSLFSFNKAELLNRNCIQNILEGVYKEVEKCIRKVYLFYVVIFKGKNHYSLEDFLGSKYAWHKIQDEKNKVNSMFHSERIIHSHIGYLNSFRKYAFFVLDNNNEQKRLLNKLIIKYIEKYIRMFEGESRLALKSSMTDVLVQHYKKCIKKIKDKDYYEFVLDIDRETGKRI